MEAIGKDPKTFEVIIHQLVHLNKGGVAVKMSKRAGEFITLRELAQDVGVDACRFFFASRTPNSHLNFDIELAKKQTQENPVYYVQYVHARIASVFAAAKKLGMKADDASVLSDKLEPHVGRFLIKPVRHGGLHKPEGSAGLAGKTHAVKLSSGNGNLLVGGCKF